MSTIESTCFLVEGVHEDDDTKKALQPLYDIFAEHGMGQATFEIVEGQPTRLWIKHVAGAQPSAELIDEALRRAGDYRVVGRDDSAALNPPTAD